MRAIKNLLYIGKNVGRQASPGGRSLPKNLWDRIGRSLSLLKTSKKTFSQGPVVLSTPEAIFASLLGFSEYPLARRAALYLRWDRRLRCGRWERWEVPNRQRPILDILAAAL